MSTELRGPVGEFAGILSPEALAFVADLQRVFGKRRLDLLQARADRQERLDRGELPGFLASTLDVRRSEWRVAPVPSDLVERKVEITGPVDRKMMINALNSGASLFMADFEDATSPTWANLIEGQANLVDAYRRTLFLDTPDKTYRLHEDTARLIIRPRGWHLSERHFLVDGQAVSASLFDFGMYLFHGGRAALEAGTGPYFYLPKLESHLEARLWNDVFVYSQEKLGIARGTIKATVLIETLLAAFEMDEILFELKEHSAGLNAGRWDYIFSVIKKLRNHPEFVLPDRTQVTMTVPFMRAYTELQVATCHRRGAHAIGGMAAFIPNRRDPEVTERALARVAEDKAREAAQGCDGTWVAHPDLVPVARACFDQVLGDAPNQLDRSREDVKVGADDLLNMTIEGGKVTEAGIRTNVNVGIRYLTAWLGGIGAAAIDNLMEDVATAEISRSQIWQWVHHGVALDDGRRIDADLVRAIAAEEMAAMTGDFHQAWQVFEEVALGAGFVEFLTLPAYELID
ncbi:MAG TPA: malate synthase A [Acidimicrobiia bacterium]|nr:malate synthase A [Acidimicrobiia bacterium]